MSNDRPKPKVKRVSFGGFDDPSHLRGEHCPRCKRPLDKDGAHECLKPRKDS